MGPGHSYSYGLNSYGLISYGLNGYGLISFGDCPIGLATDIVMA